LKKVLKLSTQSINSVSSINCCKKNCVQPFPRVKIHTLRTQFFHEGGQYFKSHRLLDVHRQIHHDSDGNKMIMLEGCDVYPVHGIQSWVYRGQCTTDGRLTPAAGCVLISMAMLGQQNRKFIHCKPQRLCAKCLSSPLIICLTVATQDRVFPYYVPNSSIKHSKSDSKDRSQEIL
jgi:hypothetical protein